MAEQGPRGSSGYPANQRPTNFGGDMKLPGKSRVSRDDVAAVMQKSKKPRSLQRFNKKARK